MFEGFFGDDEQEGRGFKDRLGVSRMMKELEFLRIDSALRLDGASSAFATSFSFNSLNTR